eukprot:3978674-Amphidinium_carterae.1
MLRKKLQLKVLYLMSEYFVEWTNVWNSDETGVRLSPNPLTGWAPVGCKPQFKTGSKQATTVTLMVCAADAPVLSQILFAGATHRVLPTGLLLEHVQVNFGDNHWANTLTLVQCIEQLQAFIVMRDGSISPYILVLDCAPVHVSVEFREKVASTFPHCFLVYVAPSASSFSQPLDIAYTRSFKSKVQTEAASLFAHEVLDHGFSDLGLVKRVPEQRLDLVTLVKDATLAIAPTCNKAGWGQIVIADDEWDEPIALAHSMQKNGRLFVYDVLDNADNLELEETDPEPE